MSGSLGPGLAGGPDLVIGIGNPLRGDDGVGWWLARRARRRGDGPPPGVKLVQQLTPELALELAAARRVLFVDAWCPGSWGPEPMLRPLVAAQIAGPGSGAGECGAFSHALDPAHLVALTTLLEGAAPPAWELLVPAFTFPHGMALSPDLRRALPRALVLLRSWLADA